MRGRENFGIIQKRAPARGVAFVLVLWVIAMLAILLGSFSLVARTESLQARHLFDTTQARYAAEAGLNLAVFELAKVDPLEKWAADGRPYAFNYGEAQIEVRITDDTGKIDLNAICNTPAGGTTTPDVVGPAVGLSLLINLFVSHGVQREKAQSLVAAVSDWCDPGDETQPNGAEINEYKAAGLSYGPKNAPFDTVSELQQVLGMNYAIFAKIEPSLTIHTGQSQPNTGFADAETLAAMYPDATPEELQQLVQQRRSIPPSELAASGLTLPGGAPIGTGGGGLTYSMKLRAKLPNGASTILDATIRMGGVSAAGRPFVILRWRDGETS